MQRRSGKLAGANARASDVVTLLKMEWRVEAEVVSQRDKQ